MYVNLVPTSVFLDASNWAVRSFVPVREIKPKEGIAMVALKDLVEERKGLRKNPEYSTASTFLGLEDVEPNLGLVLPNRSLEGRSVKTGSKTYRQRDILFGRLRPALNKVLFVDETIPEGSCSTEFIVLSPKNNQVNPEYIAIVLRLKEINERVSSMIRGASLPRVAVGDLLEITIPVPSKEVQEQICKIVRSRQREYVKCVQRTGELFDETSSSISDLLLD
ncbi:MAG: restriction endonuclease subunit S [Atopobiaceae bacterium]|jgi:restriction endonuclease S subunit|nr:restriction endonuclease subunit S [Atopobiaceae bacterium]